jgi:DNA-directed RNA polymerase subunit RPC12/RpoP
MRIRCANCGHAIHRDELEKTLYKSEKEGTFSVKWKCAGCGSKKSAKWQASALQGHVDSVSGNIPHLVFQFIIQRFFLLDAVSSVEQLRLEKLPPVTANEMINLHEWMDKDNVLTSLPKIGT